MATVNASKWGMVNNAATVSWSATRSAGTGNATYNNPTSSDYQSIYVEHTSGGKGNEWVIRRWFIAFNVSSYATGYTITNLKLYYKPTASGSATPSGATSKVAIVKSTAQGNANSNLTTADFDSFDDSVTYAANDGTDVWLDGTTLSYFDLNSTAISAFTGSYLKVCILEYVNDYSNGTPIAGTLISGYGNYDTSGSGVTPYLSFTATPTGWSDGDINSTTSPEEKINGIEYANIIRVNSIPQTWNSFSAVSSGVTYTIYYVGALSALGNNSILYSNSSGATALPAGTYYPSTVTVFGCTSSCAWCIIDSNGIITSNSDGVCCP